MRGLTRTHDTVADAVGTALSRSGVDTVFGLIGSGNFVVTEALRDAGARFVAARHEGGATAMADGWARVTGRVGVCSVHQGPGLTNTLTALAEAAKSRTPLLVLAGDTPAADEHSNFRIDQHDLVASVGAIAERIHAPATAAADAVRALRRAQRERRPVVLNLPIDLQAAPAPGATGFVGARGGRSAPATEAGGAAGGARTGAPAGGERGAPAADGGGASTPVLRAPRPAAEDVARAADLVASAERVAIVAGRGAVLADARDALEALGARCGALLATSAVAHGLFAGLPYDAGIAGGLATPLLAELLPQADLVLAFGATLNHWTTRHGDLLGPSARIVQVDVEPQAIGAHRDVALGIVGDAAATASDLLAALERRDAAATGFRTPEIAARIAARRWADEPYEDASTGEHVDPRTLTLAVDRLLPVDRTVVVDSGHLTGWPAMYLAVPDARSWLFVNGFQAVGLGLGAAIGAAVAMPGRITVAAVGDGGLFLALPELDTAARLGLPLLVLVYDDAAYGAEVHHFGPQGRDAALARFPDADLAAIARGAGCDAVTIRAVADLDPVERWARAPSGPLVVDAKVHPGVCAAWLQDAFRAA